MADTRLIDLRGDQAHQEGVENAHVIVSSGPENRIAETRLAEKSQGRYGRLNYGEESVSVGFEEIKSQDWKEKVYNRISRQVDKLYRKPGYEM